MEISKYNIVYSDKNKVLVFNTLTSAFVKFAPSDWQFIINNEFNKVENIIIDQLHDMGILSENVENQILQYKYRFYKNAFETKTPFLYIAPTMNCNFDCFYCFEQGNKRQGLMSEKTARNIIQFLKKQDKKTVRIVWFGGEPMLGFNRIIYICQQLQKSGITYTSSMITNGSLFTEANTKLLSLLNLKFIQFSMDGIGEIHDKRRYFIGGRPSFSIIIQNLKRILTKTEIPVIIQITMDHHNPNAYEATKEFCYKEFSEYINNGKLQIGFNNVQNRTGFDTTGSCFTAEELISKEINRIKTQNNNCIKIPSLSNPCMYRASWYYAIDPEGNLYKCIEQLGNPLDRIGSLDEDFLSLKGLGLSAFEEDAFNNRECNECSVFPICGGGCPLDRIKRARGESREVCSMYKDGISRMLPFIYEKLVSNSI